MDERNTLLEAIEAQEQLRGSVPDEVIDATIAALRERLGALDRTPTRRRQMTVLFADVSGFTALSESMDAEDLSEAMDSLWRRLDAVIVEHNGTIDKHIGDAVMGLWGSGVAREDDPEQAILAALAIQSAVSEIASSDPTVASLAVRVGVNTGPVVFGEVGSAGEVTVTGDTVNVAARLESAAPIGGILISRSTYRHVRGLFEVVQRPPLEVKGKTEPVLTYTVEGIAPRPFRLPTRGVEGVDTAMVGRDEELATLQHAQQRAAAESTSASVTIVGEAGIGKSRLLYEFAEWLSLAGSEVEVFRGRADQQHQGNPYGLLRDVLAFRFEIAEDDAPDLAIDKLTSGVVQVLGDGAVDQAHLIGHLMGLDMSASPHVGHILDDARQMRDRAIHAVTLLFGAIAERTPTVVLLEDIHWADRATLVMGQQVLEACADKPLFVVAAARPLVFERVPEWGTGARDIRLDLLPLEDTAAAALTDEVLKQVSDVPEGLRDTIVERADGNPFFVEEIVKMLIEDGVIETTETEWTVRHDRLTDFRVPATLTGVIQARLDRLDRDERDLLGRASVIGRLFWDLAIPPRVEQERESVDEVHRLLGALESRELVWPHPGADFVGTQEYIFRHAVLRDVTYESVLKRLRRVYHRSVAEWLAGRAEAPGRAAMIATHYEAAGADLEAAGWYVTAGEQAQARFANTSAETYFRKALEVEDLPARDRFRAGDGLAEVVMLGARYEEAIEALHRAVAAAEESGDVDDQARALIGIAFAMLREGRSREALDVAADAEMRLRAQPVPNAGVLSETIRGSASVLLRLGEITRAKDRCEEALGLAREAGDLREIGRCAGLIGAICNSLGHYGEAAARYAEALDIDRRRGDRRAEAVWLIGSGELARLQGDYEDAASQLEEALEIQRSIGDVDQEALTLSNLGGATMGMGDFERALEILGEAEAGFVKAGGTEHLSETKRFAAQSYLGLGDIDAAADAADEAMRLARDDENPDHLGHAWRIRALVAARRGEPVGEAFATAIELFDDAGMGRDAAVTRWEWSQVDPAQASLGEEARAAFEKLGLSGFLERISPPA